MEQICDFFDLLPWNLNNSLIFWIVAFFVAAHPSVWIMKREAELRQKHPQLRESLGSLLVSPIPTIWRLAKKSYKTGSDPQGEAFVDDVRAGLLTRFFLETVLFITLGTRFACYAIEAGW